MAIAGIILIILIIVVAIFFKLVLDGFKNKERTHLQTPSELDIDFEEVRITAKNGKKLYGWWITEDLQLPTIIIVHGWGRNVGSALPYIAELYGKGFNLLTFDARNHGHSDKEKHSTLVKFAEDISSSVDFLDKQNVNLKMGIGLVGLSIGGAASIFCAAHDSRISAVVTVGAFADPVEIMRAQMRDRHVPDFLGKQIFAYMESVVGFRFSDVAPQKHIGKSNARFLLIHGKLDETIPFAQLSKLKQNAIGTNTEIWELPEKGHSDCHFEEGYWDHLLDFFERTLVMEKSVARKS